MGLHSLEGRKRRHWMACISFSVWGPRHGCSNSYGFNKVLHPGKLTRNTTMEVWKMIILFKGMLLWVPYSFSKSAPAFSKHAVLNWNETNSMWPKVSRDDHSPPSTRHALVWSQEMASCGWMLHLPSGPCVEDLPKFDQNHQFCHHPPFFGSLGACWCML